MAVDSWPANYYRNVTARDESESSNWMPDLRTLEWAAGEVEATDLAVAMEHNVPLRLDLPPGLSRDFWDVAADAAYEATWWPIIRRAKSLNEGNAD